MNRLFLLLPILMLNGCGVTVNTNADVEYLLMPGMENMDLPFSSAVRAAIECIAVPQP